MIVVFGSINVDVLVPVPHLPARGETVLGGDYVIAPGGKGANQALAARRAGAAVTMIGAVGRDPFAEIGLSLLRRDGVDLGLVAEVGRPTGCAIITVDPVGENQIAVASCANMRAEAAQVPDRLLGPQTVLVLQREVPDVENAALIWRARERGARIVMSLAPAGPIAPARLEDIDFLIANEGEAATLGGDPALAIDSIDTTGAGDTFAGVFAAGLDAGLPLDLALRRASTGAALACLAVGAQAAMPGRAAIDCAVDGLPNT